MSEIAWLPGLVVLGIGLAIGLGAAVVVRRERRRREADRRLAVRDLERQRDELYRRLRSEELSEGDRESLELRAARTLRELEQLAPAGSAAPAAPAAPTEAAPAAAPAGRRHRAGLVGFVAGLAVALLVGLLVYWALRDSGAARAPVTAAAPDQPHPDADSLPDEIRRELERLEAAVAAAPNDLLAFKRLALARLDAGLYVEAFRDAETILAARPDDPDGLFIQGVVRLSMGQWEPAIELLDTVLASYPNHLQAMLFRGLALAQGGSLEQAIDTWEMGLEMAGGSHPELESLIQQAREASQRAAAAPPSASPPPPTVAPPAAAAPGPAPAPAAPPPAATPGSSQYRVALELAPGATPAPGAVLFVFVRPDDSGPPVAVKRIAQPFFPLEVVLGAADAMMGGQLPEQGVLVARLDADGSAASRAPEDLEASAPARLGEPLRLVLDGS